LGQHNLNIHIHINQNEFLEEKKLLGSGGHAFAEQEEIKASLGVYNIQRIAKIRYQRNIRTATKQRSSGATQCIKRL
jgi:hypothetical protein